MDITFQYFIKMMNNKTNLGLFDFEKLRDEDKQQYLNKAYELIGDDLVFCTRSWDAWSVNTMRANDFLCANQDDDFIYSIAKSLYESQNNLRIKEVLNESVSAIYFNDSSDYLSFHYSIVKKLTGLENLNDEIINGMFRMLNNDK